MIAKNRESARRPCPPFNRPLSYGVKVNPLLGKGFYTLESMRGFLTLVRKMAREAVYFNQIT